VTRQVQSLYHKSTWRWYSRVS